MQTFIKPKRERERRWKRETGGDFGIKRKFVSRVRTGVRLFRERVVEWRSFPGGKSIRRGRVERIGSQSSLRLNLIKKRSREIFLSSFDKINRYEPHSILTPRWIWIRWISSRISHDYSITRRRVYIDCREREALWIFFNEIRLPRNGSSTASFLQLYFLISTTLCTSASWPTCSTYRDDEI